ncbi:unnamed protein product [Brassica rapa]|uniref:Uncharacterized protein n=1 Tax=Brassica campestris TaxID=3711 RepID=A0A8D9HDM2_BRACM|nr:unnamed protein product [Brassica rapa]
MCLIQYAECIKDCDKAFERDRKHRPGTEQPAEDGKSLNIAVTKALENEG